eukprot:796703-Prorocentrum_minimum.AAC.1
MHEQHRPTPASRFTHPGAALLVSAFTNADVKWLHCESNPTEPSKETNQRERHAHGNEGLTSG